MTYRKIEQTNEFRICFKEGVRPVPHLLESFGEAIRKISGAPDEYHEELDNHPLVPPMYPYWSFKIGFGKQDMVVIYGFTDEKVVLYDVGTHEQVYRR